MDLNLYLRVLLRFRWLVLGGLVLAALLAFLSAFKVGSGGVTWRQQKTYQATQKLLLTNLATGDNAPDYGTLTVLDAEVANGDIVRRLAQQAAGRIRATYLVTPVSGGSQVGILPVLQIDGFAHEPRLAGLMAARVADVLQRYLPKNVSGNEKVKFKTISAPTHPVVAEGRKLTVPVVIFLGVLVVTLGLVFILENLRRGSAPARTRSRVVGSGSRERLAEGPPDEDGELVGQPILSASRPELDQNGDVAGEPAARPPARLGLD